MPRVFWNGPAPRRPKGWPADAPRYVGPRPPDLGTYEEEYLRYLGSLRVRPLLDAFRAAERKAREARDEPDPDR